MFGNVGVLEILRLKARENVVLSEIGASVEPGSRQYGSLVKRLVDDVRSATLHKFVERFRVGLLDAPKSAVFALSVIVIPVVISIFRCQIGSGDGILCAEFGHTVHG